MAKKVKRVRKVKKDSYGDTPEHLTKLPKLDKKSLKLKGKGLDKQKGVGLGKIKSVGL